MTNKTAYGRVHNLSGQPLADIAILIDDVTTTKTDARGVYILDIESLTAKSIKVTAAHPLYVFEPMEVNTEQLRSSATFDDIQALEAAICGQFFLLPEDSHVYEQSMRPRVANCSYEIPLGEGQNIHEPENYVQARLTKYRDGVFDEEKGEMCCFVD